jgi:adenylosuccinate lyase
MYKVLKGIDVFGENIKTNLNKNQNVFFSQSLLNALVIKGVSRKVAYEIVQKKSFESILEKKDFLSLIQNDPDIKNYLTSDEIRNILDIKYLLRNLDKVFGKLK